MEQTEKKVYLITGGSRGIGRAICEKLAGENTVLIINYKEKKDMAMETLRLVEERGGSGEIYNCDISDYIAVKKMIAYIEKKYKKIDALVNNAGILLMRYLLFTSKEEWDKVINTNLNGAFHCVKCVLPNMIQRQKGNIVNISSVVTQKTIEGSVAYTVSKYALNGLTKSLAKEVENYNIKVNGINCGFVDTDMIQECHKYGVEINKIGSPEDIAEWVAFLLSEKMVFLSGEIITVDGGITL